MAYFVNPKFEEIYIRVNRGVQKLEKIDWTEPNQTK